MGAEFGLEYVADTLRSCQFVERMRVTYHLGDVGQRNLDLAYMTAVAHV